MMALSRRKFLIAGSAAVGLVSVAALLPPLCSGAGKTLVRVPPFKPSAWHPAFLREAIGFLSSAASVGFFAQTMGDIDSSIEIRHAEETSTNGTILQLKECLVYGDIPLLLNTLRQQRQGEISASKISGLTQLYREKSRLMSIQ